MVNMMKFYKYTFAVLLIILVFLLMPPSNIPSVGIPNLDKLVHFGMFAFLAMTLCAETYLYYKKFPTEYRALSFLVVYAILTEALQYLSGYRTFDIYDIIADVLGIIFGLAISKLIYKTKNKCP